MDIARRHNLVVIEDGAHSLGANYKGRKVGSQADMTMFSFHPVKPITTGEGGMITTNSKVFYEKLKLFRSHGISKTPYAIEQGDWYYEMTELGFNYRMNDIQAALYNEKLASVRGIILPEQLEDTESGWHLYMIQLDSKVLTKSRREIFDEMRTRNIGVHVHYNSVYWQPYYQDLGYEKGLCPVAKEWYAQALTLPVFPGMTGEDVGDVVGVLSAVVR